MHLYIAILVGFYCSIVLILLGGSYNKQNSSSFRISQGFDGISYCSSPFKVFTRNNNSKKIYHFLAQTSRKI